MTARFPTVDVIGCGQSQAIMGFTGGGETNDAGFAATGGQRLAERLGQLQAGVTFNILGSSGVGTMEADTVLFEEFRAGAASQGFYQGSPFAPLPKGTTQLAYINSRAAANKLGVVVIYQHAQDVNAGGAWSDASYAAFSAALVDRMISDAIAAGWGDYAILAVLSSTRGNGTNEALTAYRRTWDALAGHDQWQGLTRRTRVLRPVYLAHKLDIDRWSNTSSDRTHMVASTAGATFRHNPVNTATARFVLLGGGTITAAAAPDNSNSVLGFATIDLTVSGLTADSRLAYAVNFAAAEFENGDTPPRGALRNTAWAIAAGTTLANPVTDEAQDAKLPAGQFALGMANNDRGVALEAA